MSCSLCTLISYRDILVSLLTTLSSFDEDKCTHLDVNNSNINLNSSRDNLYLFLFFCGISVHFGHDFSNHQNSYTMSIRLPCNISLDIICNHFAESIKVAKSVKILSELSFFNFIKLFVSNVKTIFSYELSMVIHNETDSLYFIRILLVLTK